MRPVPQLTALVASAVIALASAASAQDAAACSSGARTLAAPGSVVYPDQGNGGYQSLHTDLFLVYDAATNLFLPGNHVDLKIKATQCLTDFSLDFERTNANAAGPNMTVSTVLVDGQPATFAFVQPTYPGDPNGQDDADPAAHVASATNPVSAANPNPPACSPQGSSPAASGVACPANKLLITPSAPIPDGATVTVTVHYTGRPGVHVDGDGITEGWFRTTTPAGDGGIVVTEPVGAMAWRPLNNHPSAKPTVDVYATIPTGGRSVVSAGVLVSTTTNPPDANFPGGSDSWHWQSTQPIANYLLTVAIGAYEVSAQVGASGITFYEAQSSAIATSRKATNKAILDQQENIVLWLSQFAGPYPFATLGSIVTTATAAFQEAMLTQNVFPSSTATVGVLYNSTLQQWLGGNVSESSFEMTFFQTGIGQLGTYLQTAKTAADTAGGQGTPAGDAAFEQSLISRFNATYNSTSATFWTVAPSKPTVGTLFSNNPSFVRPANTYIALRHILTPSRWATALQQIQQTYGGGNITKAQLEDAFHQALPNQSAACHTQLNDFFSQWFDTAYPSGAGANKPQITGPGLAGPGFYDDLSPCTRADASVTFAPLADRPLNAPDFLVAATASNGGPVAFTASGVCTVTDALVHLTGAAGSCAITAAVSGDAVFKPGSTTQTFNVTTGVTFTQSGFSLNPVTKRYARTVVLTNTTNGNLPGPVSFVLDNLVSGTLLAPTGVAASGGPYVNTAPAGLAPGQQVSITLQFTNPTAAPITYTPRVVVGPGPR